MQRTVRWAVGATALAMVLTLGAMLPTASVSAAAPGCVDADCDGKDPNLTGCARDARTMETKYFKDGKVELRWSPTCGTNWARVTSLAGDRYQRVSIKKFGSWRENHIKVSYGAVAYTPMQYARRLLVKACASQGKSRWFMVDNNCTGYH